MILKDNRNVILDVFLPSGQWPNLISNFCSIKQELTWNSKQIFDWKLNFQDFHMIWSKRKKDFMVKFFWSFQVNEFLINPRLRNFKNFSSELDSNYFRHKKLTKLQICMLKVSFNSPPFKMKSTKANLSCQFLVDLNRHTLVYLSLCKIKKNSALKFRVCYHIKPSLVAAKISLKVILYI